MKLDPVRFKEHLVRMRRDREMEREKLVLPLKVSGGDVGIKSIMSRLQDEIQLLAELHAAVEDSMEQEIRDETSPSRIG